MFWLWRILIGLVIIALGASMVYKTQWYLGLLERSYWAERNFGPGGTRLLYKAIGVIIVVIGMIIVTDLWEILIGNFIVNLFSPGRA